MISPLGVFDSGFGGFTVLKRVLEFCGQKPCLYLADTARVPYGDRSPSEIRLIAEEVVGWLDQQDISAVLVACNTTNSLAMDVVQKVATTPVFGLIESSAEMIFEDRVGVLCTTATASSSAYKQTIQAFRPGTLVFEQACPELVPLIEAGELDSPRLRQLVFGYLKPLLSVDVKAVVLGCSHYPLIEPLLKQMLPIGVRLIDPALGLAMKLENHLNSSGKTSFRVPLDFSGTRFCVTSDPLDFSSRAKPWLGMYPEVELISLRSKACIF